jgi:L-asparagine permease
MENERELTGDVASAVRDFSSEEQGYHKTPSPAGSR